VVVLGVAGFAQAAPSRSTTPSYAPTRGQCPANVQLFRPANGLSGAEKDWIYGRKRVVTNALASYLTQLGLENFDVGKYIACIQNSNYSHTPVMGFAISGGGYASALTGTGMLRALDSRLHAANEQKTGGLLQSMMYMSGQSGGSWPIMSFSINNFPTADEILDIWQPQINRNNAEKTTKYAATPEDIIEQVIPKLEAGFNVTFADYEGRSASYEFVGGTLGGIDRTFSGLVNVQKFKNHQMPLPLIDISEVVPGDQKIFGLPIPAFDATIVSMDPKCISEESLTCCSMIYLLSSLELGMVRLLVILQQNILEQLCRMVLQPILKHVLQVSIMQGEYTITTSPMAISQTKEHTQFHHGISSFSMEFLVY